MVGPAAPPGRVLVGAPARREGFGSVHSAPRSGDRSHQGLCALGHESGRTGGLAGKGFGGSAGPSRRGWLRASCFAARRPLPPGVCVRSVTSLVGPAAPPGRVLVGAPARREGFGRRAFCFAVRRPLLPGVCALGRRFGRTGGPAGKGLGSVHSASRSGDRSHRGCASGRASSSSGTRGSILLLRKRV